MDVIHSDDHIQNLKIYQFNFHLILLLTELTEGVAISHTKQIESIKTIQIT